jgi:hypothetical protein
MHPMEMLNAKIRDTDDRFTKREYIAAQLYQSLIGREKDFNFSMTTASNLSLTAIQCADMLIENLRTKPAGAVK